MTQSVSWPVLLKFLLIEGYSLLRFLLLLMSEQNNPVLGGGPISIGAWFLCVILIQERGRQRKSVMRIKCQVLGNSAAIFHEVKNNTRLKLHFRVSRFQRYFKEGQDIHFSDTQTLTQRKNQLKSRFQYGLTSNLKYPTVSQSFCFRLHDYPVSFLQHQSCIIETGKDTPLLHQES